MQPQSDAITGGTVLRIPALQSPNFAAGSTGWIIRGDGTAEFNGATFRGTVIVQGNQAILFYSGVPAAGNLVASISPVAGTDGFGNAYPSGYVIFNGSELIKVQSAGGPFATPAVTFDTGAGNSGAPGAPGVIYAINIFGNDLLSVSGPKSSTDTQHSNVTMTLSSGEISTANANGKLSFNSDSGGIDFVKWDQTGFNITAGSIKAPTPGSSNPPTVESWHNLALTAAFQQLAGFGVPRYQKESINGGRTRLSGVLQLVGNQVAGTLIATLPTGYRPTNTIPLLTGNNLSGASGQLESIYIHSDGTITLGEAGSNGNYVELNGQSFELD